MLEYERETETKHRRVGRGGRPRLCWENEEQEGTVLLSPGPNRFGPEGRTPIDLVRLVG